MPLLNPNKIQRIVRILSVIIAEDETIDNNTVIDRVSNTKKSALIGTVSDPAKFLSGVFLYVLSCTDNQAGKKEKGFAKRILAEYEQLTEGYSFESLAITKKSVSTGPVPSQINTEGVEAAEIFRIRELSYAEERISQEVRSFCMDYDSEMSLLPLCQVIAVTDPLRRHVRKMYNDFCKCTTTVQNRILTEKSVIPIVVSDQNWWCECFNKFIQDYRRFELGSKDYEYMFSQYVPRALYECQDEPVKKATTRKYKSHISSPFTNFKGFHLDIAGVLDEYMYYKDQKEYKGQFAMPMDFFYQDLNFGDCDEPLLIMYLCQFMIGACSGVLLSRRRQHPERDCFSFPDNAYCGPGFAETETLEDLFFATLHMLYRTYMVDDEQ